MKWRRGVSFAGFYKQDGGKFTLRITRTLSIFQEMESKLENNDYKTLIEMCKKQIKSTPDWYTPYLFLGIAYLKTGDTNNAKKYFNYLIKEVSTEPYVSEARRYLRETK